MKTTLTVMAMMSLAATAGAQVVVHEQQPKAAAEQHLQLLLEKVPASGLHVSFEARPVTGAPYSGEAVTETVQVLGDGNRIVRRTTSRIFRDGKGRTRRETLGPDGQVTSVAITDPTGGKSYMFDPSTNTARLSGVATFVSSVSSTSTHAEGLPTTGTVTVYASPEARKEGETKIVREVAVTSHLSTGQAGVAIAGPGAGVSAGAGASSPSTKEDLGQQTIDGVMAKGTRTTTVIPAGAIGNEQPITVIGEEWFSPELQVLVMTKHVDPRAGETTYRLTGISRNEPNPSLFELPAGITVK
jgi:hypothetical protein